MLCLRPSLIIRKLKSGEKRMANLKIIKSIRNCRNFIQFESNQEFYKHEIIYAPNGSGKTNFTRLVDMLHNPTGNLNVLKSKECNESENVEFEFCFDEQSIITQDNFAEENSQKIIAGILVFNSDYINNNIICPDFRDKNLDGDILLELGASDSEISETKREIKRQKNSIAQNVKQLRSDFNERCDKLKKEVYSPKEANIWKAFSIEEILLIKENDLGSSEINQPGLEDIASLSLEDAKERRIQLLQLGDEEEFKVADKLPEIDFLEIQACLQDKMSFSVDDERATRNFQFILSFLKPYIGLSTPVSEVLKQAISKSEETGRCILCGQNLGLSSQELFVKYKKFLADERTKYENALIDKQKKIKMLREYVLKLTNPEANRIKRIVTLLRIEPGWQDYDVSEIVIELDEICKALDKKITCPEDEVNISAQINTQISNLKAQMSHNNKILLAVNRKIENASVELAKTRAEVGKKELQDFVMAHQTIISDITDRHKAIDRLEKKLKALNEAAPTISIRENTCKMMNVFLHNYLGIEKYRAEVVNNQVVIKLNEYDISESMDMLSDGEKMMIGLAFFLASSIHTLRNERAYGDAIFIIDDPLSSVSYSNIFGVCTLIANFQEEILSQVWSKALSEKGQVIILTHNIQFFNIMRTQIWSKEKRSGEQNRDGYAILNNDTIRHIDKGHLLSDFESSLLVIYEAKKKQIYYNVCNSIRRVCEILKHFYGIKGDFSVEALGKIFPYIKEKRYDALYKTINFFSHGSANPIDVLPPNIVEAAVREFIEIFSSNESPFLETWETMKGIAESLDK